MSPKTSRRLVIDTSVAHASGGEEAIYPTSKNCRDFLKTVLTVCHQIVMTPDIFDEWKKHQSKFARSWLVSMRARKKVNRHGNPVDIKLREKINKLSISEKNRQAMLKDIHLIEAAGVADQTVISLDETVRGLYHSASARIGLFKNIIWVNPDKIDEQSFLWLKNGAKPEKKRLLGVDTQ